MKKFVAGVIVGVLIGAIGWVGAQNGLSSRETRSLFAGPTSSTSWGFYSGNRYLSTTESFQLGYVAGVNDSFLAFISEVFEWEEWFYQEGLEQARLDGSTPKPKHEYEQIAAGLAYTKLRLLLHYTPDEATLGQLRDVVSAYLDSRPAERHNNAALIVWRALAEAEWK